MDFYSKITGINYPWNKYSQIVVRDYVSGAMENTTATLHGEYVQKTPRELLDQNEEGTICHELFHQWFGDYVTAESWSNITLNESFATLSEILWAGQDKGKDAEDAERYDKLQSYLSTTKNGISPKLVRFHYKQREEVFDEVSYPKGSVILYALKNYLGDKAFFAGLNLYLRNHAFQSAEASDLRLAFEQVSGLDLQEYFNQWYYSGGHPVLDISSHFESGVLSIEVSQIQDKGMGYFKFPLKIGIYNQINESGKVKSWQETKVLTVDGLKQTYKFTLSQKPIFIDYDVDKILVGEILDHKKIEDYISAYTLTHSYSNRMEAVQNALKDSVGVNANSLLIKALHDPYYKIRKEVISGLHLTNAQNLSLFETELKNIILNDPFTVVRAAAIEKFAETYKTKYKELYLNGLKSQSYEVIASSLTGLLNLSPNEGESLISSFDPETKIHLLKPIGRFYASKGEDGMAPFFEKIFLSGTNNQKFLIFRNYIAYLSKNTSPKISQNGVDAIITLVNSIQDPGFTDNMVSTFDGISIYKGKSSHAENDSKIKSDLEEGEKIFKEASKRLKSPLKS